MATTSAVGVCSHRAPAILFRSSTPAFNAARRQVLLRSANDTGSSPSKEGKASTSSTTADDDLEAFENRLKGNRKRKVEAKVQVSAPAVDLATGKTAATPEAEFEGRVVFVLLLIFSGILLEGLALAASGFLPEEYDDFISKAIYPSFSPTVLLFLGVSSFYGLWKTGKLPGQRQL